MDDKYMKIVSHYESCLEKHGDRHLGVDWPREADVDTRHRVMLDVVRRGGEGASLLDFGCGASHFYEYLQKTGEKRVRYSGLDLSPKFVALSRSKFPENEYYELDVLREGDKLPLFDYVVMNGVFTQKRELSFDEMFEFLKSVLRAVFPKTRNGLAFNVMSKHADWERPEAFHLPLDALASFLTKELSRNFTFRHDYGLYEYTAYVYR